MNLSPYQSYIYTSKYSRYIDVAKCRETWDETVDRYLDYMCEQQVNKLKPLRGWLRNLMVGMEVLPSMRALWTAGPALERDEISSYNCSYTPIDSPRIFDEIMYILMCGTGVGFSVERQYINLLPMVSDDFHPTNSTIEVADSRIGWAAGLRELVSLLYVGQVPKWELGKIRPAGSRLKTFGGRSSGPEPLDDLFHFLVDTFKEAAGRKLTSLECHDIVCKTASIVISGGVRRSALLSLSNLTDERMRHAKDGNWQTAAPYRAASNNSVAYTETPDIGIFMREWETLYASKSGERGIFNRVAATKQAEDGGRRVTEGIQFGSNPCMEIVLRPRGLCNLTEVVIRSDDTLERMREKVKAATILGTVQATLTNFRYLRKEWQTNAEEERLLGVSLTGICDHVDMADSGVAAEMLPVLKQTAIETNREWARRLGIPVSAAITCIKPSGTVSQLVNSSSGIHPRYSKYYIRTVRSGVHDPVTKMLMAQGVPHEPDLTATNYSVVFSFPVESPAGAVLRDDVSAVDQLQHYLTYRRHWCEHNPSTTIYVQEHEWLKVGAWVYEHFDELGGIAFLPHTKHSYRQAPYQEITAEEYQAKQDAFPVLDWGRSCRPMSWRIRRNRVGRSPVRVGSVRSKGGRAWGKSETSTKRVNERQSMRWNDRIRAKVSTKEASGEPISPSFTSFSTRSRTACLNSFDSINCPPSFVSIFSYISSSRKLTPWSSPIRISCVDAPPFFPSSKPLYRVSRQSFTAPVFRSTSLTVARSPASYWSLIFPMLYLP